jgi:hypothetical protein
MNALASAHSLSDGAWVVALTLTVAWCVSIVCLTSVRVWSARRAWRRAKNLLVGR